MPNSDSTDAMKSTQNHLVKPEKLEQKLRSTKYEQDVKIEKPDEITVPAPELRNEQAPSASAKILTKGKDIKRSALKQKEKCIMDSFGTAKTPNDSRRSDQGISNEQRGFSKRFETLMHVPNPMEVPGEEDLLSDDEEDVNRSGAVPLWWYDKYDHIGYDMDGKQVEKAHDTSLLGQLLAKGDPEAWRKIVDVRNNRTVRLTDEDLKLISCIRSSRFPSTAAPDDDYYIDSDLEDSIFPMRNAPVPKSRFLPSKHEQKKINRLIKLIRLGLITAKPDRRIVDDISDIWGPNIFRNVDSGKDKLSIERIPAPKLALPGHSESFNPPEEYLLNEEERKEWEAMEPEERPMSFLPQKFTALRRVPAYPNLLLERYQRCLDLYLCPRAIKMRMNVDPNSLLPVLPSPSELRPFPTGLSLDYLPLAAYAQKLPPTQPLYGLLLPYADAANKRLELPAFEPTAPLSDDERKAKMVAQHLVGPSGAARVCSIDYTGRYVAVGGLDGVLRIFELLTGKLFVAFQLQMAVTAVAFHPSLPIVAFASAEQLLLLSLDVPKFEPTAISSVSVSSNTSGTPGPTKRRGKGHDKPLPQKMEAETSNGDKCSDDLCAQAKRLLLVMEAPKEGTPDLMNIAAAQATERRLAGKSEDKVEEYQNVSQSSYLIKEDIRASITGKWLQVSLRHAREAKVETEKLVNGLAETHRRVLMSGKDNYLEQPHEPTLPLNGVSRAVFIMHDSPIKSLSWHRKGTYLIAVCPGSNSPSNQLIIHSLSKHKGVKPIHRHGHGAIKDACFHPQKPWLIVAYQNGLRIYDLHAKKNHEEGEGTGQIVVKKLLGIDGAASIGVHPIGDHLIVGAESRRLYFYDLMLSNTAFKIFRGHSGALTSTGFHPQLPLFYSASQDGTVQIYHCKVFDDLMTNPLIVPVKILQVAKDAASGGGVLSCTWHPTKPWLVTTDQQGNCGLWT